VQPKIFVEARHYEEDSMKLLSLNVGVPREVTWNGQTVLTGIFKDTVDGPRMLRRLNLDGDRQADLSVHGGPTKAAYLYPSEHYPFWKEELPDTELPFGVFGENFTTEGLDEQAICIGDRFSIGKAQVVVTEPRMPCFKLAIRFGRPDMLKRFLKSGRTGFYFGVLEEGEVQAGDEISLLGRDPSGLKVSDVTRLYSTERGNAELLAKAISVETLPEKWRGYFQHQLEILGARD
jgi:MOSC domain-containing protein YiiM